jgi:hypothetical protein
MPRCFFDTCDEGRLIRDEEGQDVVDINEAHKLATTALVDMARDAIPGAVRRELTVEVRDDTNRQLIRASLWLEVAVLASEAS